MGMRHLERMYWETFSEGLDLGGQGANFWWGRNLWSPVGAFTGPTVGGKTAQTGPGDSLFLHGLPFLAQALFGGVRIHRALLFGANPPLTVFIP